MKKKSALETALIAWNEHQQGADAEAMAKRAIELAQFGVFSNRNIALITGLSYEAVLKMAPKSSKLGGRFNPEALPLIYDLYLAHSRGGKDPKLACTIVRHGVSSGFLERLTGVPSTSVDRWVAQRKETEKANVN